MVTYTRINHNDLTWSYVNLSYWSMGELTALFICACIPISRPLFVCTDDKTALYVQNCSFVRVNPPSRSRSTGNLSQHPPVTFDSLGLAHQASRPSTSPAGTAAFERIEDPASYEVKAYGGKPMKSFCREDDVEHAIPMRAIHVQSDLEQTG